MVWSRDFGRGVQEKNSVMKCTICKTGHTHPGIATVTRQGDNAVVVLRNVPADICEDCGEYYLVV